jgi:hypothetical protein
MLMSKKEGDTSSVMGHSFFLFQETYPCTTMLTETPEANGKYDIRI